jgi:hypothetical protein
MQLLILTILLLSFGQQAQAKQIQSFKSGNLLVEQCGAYINNINLAKGNICVGYIQGIADLHETFSEDLEFMDKKWCLPKGGGDQLVKVVIKYYQEHPEYLHRTAGGGVAYAFHEAFPCEEKTK